MVNTPPESPDGPCNEAIWDSLEMSVRQKLI